jgi:hypothetical protein
MPAGASCIERKLEKLFAYLNGIIPDLGVIL